MWPHAPSLAQRIAGYVKEIDGNPAVLKQKWNTSGRQVRQPRKPGSRLAAGPSQASLQTAGTKSQQSLKQQPSAESLIEPAAADQPGAAGAEEAKGEEQGPQLPADLQRDIDVHSEDAFN